MSCWSVIGDANTILSVAWSSLSKHKYGEQLSAVGTKHNFIYTWGNSYETLQCPSYSAS